MASSDGHCFRGLLHLEGDFQYVQTNERKFDVNSKIENEIRLLASFYERYVYLFLFLVDGTRIE